MSLFTPGLFTTVAILVLVIFLLSAALRILKEYERGVIFRLCRIINSKWP
jgi:regulator of protease activity HflC (stomatin/prohibitin superfamily)